MYPANLQEAQSINSTLFAKDVSIEIQGQVKLLIHISGPRTG